jgi:hypothetical protein
MSRKPLPRLEEFEKAASRLLTAAFESSGKTRPSAEAFRIACRIMARRAFRKASEAFETELAKEVQSATKANVASLSYNVAPSVGCALPDPEAPGYIGTYTPSPPYRTG